MDEKRGREAARHHGLAVGGGLGEPNLRSEINRLRSKAGFFVDAEIEKFILAQVGK